MNSRAEVEAGHNLPSRLTSFVGRESEIADVGALLGAHRLVTLVGAPGVGKTRLGLQIAATLVDRFPDGVWLVELASLADPALVPQAVADVLGVREQPGRPLTTTLAEHLRSRHLLLLLDNCEHLIGAVASLAETLLQACPSLHILATSREPLTIEGELTHRVPTLADAEGMRLFVERALAASPSFTLTERTTPIIGQICARLDGIPLAIELAAARVRALSVDQIAARLDNRFRLLIGGSRTALPRQQTLRGAVDWSYDLLSEPEKALLRRLSVFAGGFTLDAAETAESWILSSGQESATSSSPRAQSSEPTTLVGLVDKSLVQVDEGTEDGERRYRLLETFRQYGGEKLIEHGEMTAARDRHRDYFLAFVEEVSPALNERSDRTVLTRVEREHDNLRVALAWCLERASLRGDAPLQAATNLPPSDAALGVRLAAPIWRFWWLRGYLGEGRRWLERVLAEPPSGTSPAGRSARQMALHGLANLSAYQGDYRAAVTHMTENLAFCRETGNERGVVTALHRLGFYLVHLSENERAGRLCEESVALGRQVGHPPTLAGALHASGIVAYILGRYEQSIALSEEAIGLFRQGGNLNPIAYALRSQGRATADLGDPVKATLLAEEGLRLSQDVGDRRGVVESYKDLGRYALLAGDVGRAMELLRMGIVSANQLDDRWMAIICISILAGVKIEQGTRTPSRDAASLAPTDEGREHLLDAARLFAMADHLRGLAGLHLPSDLQTTYDRDTALLREHLGDVEFSQARAEGQARSFEQAVEYALAIAAPAAPEAARTAPGPATTAGAPGQDPAGDPEVARLSPREREVAALVTQGLTNRQMAETLVLSERTVDSHVRSIMGKLEVNSRARIAAWVVKHGLIDEE